MISYGFVCLRVFCDWIIVTVDVPFVVLDWCLQVCGCYCDTLRFLGIFLSSQVGTLIRTSLQLRFISSCLKEEGWIHQKITQNWCKWLTIVSSFLPYPHPSCLFFPPFPDLLVLLLSRSWFHTSSSAPHHRRRHHHHHHHHRRRRRHHHHHQIFLPPKLSPMQTRAVQPAINLK